MQVTSARMRRGDYAGPWLLTAILPTITRTHRQEWEWVFVHDDGAERSIVLREGPPPRASQVYQHFSSIKADP